MEKQKARYIDWRKEKEILCDGCNVNYPFEHRCHGNKSVVMGEFTNLPCQCSECREEEKIFEKGE